MPLLPFITNTHVAYFTMEIALKRELHTYSGGLGVLAGDAARSSADLQIPIVFVTLLSRQGYLFQELDPAGKQIDHPDPWRPEDYAKPLETMVMVRLGGRPVWIRPWLYVHGANDTNPGIPVVLLDTQLDQNAPEDRAITDRLYGGDAAYRLKQEAILGIGGVRVLRALGFTLHTFHMNEGHAALLAVELMQTRKAEAKNGTPARMDNCIFTTHTPIEAGHDVFPYPLITDVLGDFVAIDELKKYAGPDACNMTLLALNMSGYVNSVATRHAETTRRMFPGYKISAITNGVHLPTWVHPVLQKLYDKFLPNWRNDPGMMVMADRLLDETIWDAHLKAKEDLCRSIETATGTKMAVDVPLLSFARRMTGYKRPELLFSDLERLKAMARENPFQIVLAGKAHPRDDNGKALIAQLHTYIEELKEVIPIAFLPNYDLDIAKKLVSGADVWLNTPIPPMEASGTSGMKAAANGVLNLSVLDGWWIEAYVEGVTGWAIGKDDIAQMETHSAPRLYEKLEGAVLPLYYGDRGRWIWMMKQSISKIASRFNSHRMMYRYAAEAYLR